MLIRFSVENYMSFKEQQVFSMAAEKGARHPSHIAMVNGKRILKSSFLFGANAAGKSNFIHAIDFMRSTVVTGSSKTGNRRDKYFRIDPSCIEKPGVFQVEIATRKAFYSYGFSINYRTRLFEAEWLYDISDEKEACIFERDIEEGTLRTELRLMKNSADKMRYEVYKSDITAERLFLTEIAEKELDEKSAFTPLKEVYRWFERLSIIYPGSHARGMMEFFVRNGEDTQLSRLLSDFDTGIESVSSSKEPIEKALSFLPSDVKSSQLDRLEGSIRENEELHQVLENNGRVSINLADRKFILSMEDGNLMAEELKMDHGNSDDKFDLADESEGTQRLFDLIPAYEIMKNGRVVFVDEVDRSFHSALTQEYVRRYFEITDGCACQMICTTHDLNLMTLNLLRRDEIWFVERKANHSSEIYSLSEFKTRNDKNIANDYLIGRYGAIPFITETKREEG